jgi:hypothetical protein
MRKHEELEFSFWGAKGRAVGRFPIIVLALLLLVAIAVIALLPRETGLFSFATSAARGFLWREQEATRSVRTYVSMADELTTQKDRAPSIRAYLL